MARLTEAEWADAEPPFSYLAVKNSGWDQSHRYQIVEWIEGHIKGWFYHDGADLYVFGSEADYMLFRLWVSDDPFATK